MSNYTEKTKERFTFDLTNQELLARADEASKLQTILRQKQNEFLAIKKAKKASIDVVADQVDSLLNIVLAKQEDREVECMKVYDCSTRTVRYLFMGEIMAERQMDNSEYNYAMQKSQENPTTPTTPHLTSV